MEKETNSKLKQTRSQAREAAFTQIFQINQHGEEIPEMISRLVEDQPECENNLGYIQSVVQGVAEKRDELVGEVEKYLKPGWSIKRVSKVPLTILKLAIYEIKYVDDVPEKVAINEAVNLAKKFGEEKDAKFVNGILASFLKNR